MRWRRDRDAPVPTPFQIVLLPETMFLTWIFLATGFALGFVALFWLRRTGQLRLW